MLCSILVICLHTVPLWRMFFIHCVSWEYNKLASCECFVKSQRYLFLQGDSLLPLPYRASMPWPYIHFQHRQICHILGERVKKGINAVGHFVLVLTKSFCFSAPHPHAYPYKHSQRGEEGPAGEAGCAAPASFPVFLGSGKGRSGQPNWRKMPFTSLLRNELSPNQFFIEHSYCAQLCRVKNCVSGFDESVWWYGARSHTI